MRKSLLPFILLMIPGLVSSQSYVEVGGFPDDTTFTGLMHGVAVDAEGKVWLTPFGSSAWIVDGDSVRDANGDAIFTRAIYVYNADGTEAMSPIRTVTTPEGGTDTLTSSARGLRADHNGDILHVDGSGNMWRFNHETGEGMNWMDTEAPSAAQPGVSNDGIIYTGSVLPAEPIKMWNSDFTFLANAVDSARGFSRGFDVSGDGNTIYWGGFTNGQLHVYSRDDEFSEFGVPDTVWRGIWAESFTRDPDGAMWISNDMRADSGTVWADPSKWLTWTTFDEETGKGALHRSFQFTLEHPSEPATEFARGMAFSPDGMYAYAVLWDANTSGQEAPDRQVAVKKFMKAGGVAIERDGLDIPTSFELSQSYPNPFNPTATINFKLTEQGAALLTVYDAYGRQVGTLVNETLAAGSYNATFDARDLASGTYFYHLEFNGQRLSGKMTLLK